MKVQKAVCIKSATFTDRKSEARLLFGNIYTISLPNEDGLVIVYKWIPGVPLTEYFAVESETPDSSSTSNS